MLHGSPLKWGEREDWTLRKRSILHCTLSCRENQGGGEGWKGRTRKIPRVLPTPGACLSSTRALNGPGPSRLRAGRCDRLRTRASARIAHQHVALLTRQSVKGATPLARRVSTRVFSGRVPSRIQAGVPVPRRASGANSGPGPPFGRYDRRRMRAAARLEHPHVALLTCQSVKERPQGGLSAKEKVSQHFRSAAPFASLTLAALRYKVLTHSNPVKSQGCCTRPCTSECVSPS